VSSGSASAFAPFRVRAFRFQWPSDLLVAFALEIENIILGWYILVETKSVVLLTAFAALQFLGSLLAPYFGMLADRMGRRVMLYAMRLAFAGLAMVLMVLGLTDSLSAPAVFVVAFFGGLLKTSELMLRQALSTDILPANCLMPAMGLSRVTLDGARVFGALTGAGLFAWLGFGISYVVVAAFYVSSFLLMRAATLGGAGQGAAGQGEGGARTKASSPSPARLSAPAPAAGVAIRPVQSGWRDLRDGLVYVYNTPRLLGICCLVVMLNLLAFPLTAGLLPYVAREVYALDELGYGRLVAAHAVGALAGSLMMTVLMRPVNAARLMLIASIAWQAVIVVFALIRDPAWGMFVLALLGACQSVTMVSLTAAVLGAAAAEFRARVMGVRMLGVYGLPVGLVTAGYLVNAVGFAPTLALFGLLGVAGAAFVARRWRRALWA